MIINGHTHTRPVSSTITSEGSEAHYQEICTYTEEPLAKMALAKMAHGLWYLCCTESHEGTTKNQSSFLQGWVTEAAEQHGGAEPLLWATFRH